MKKILSWFRYVVRKPRRRTGVRLRTHYKKHKESARSLVLERLSYWNQFYQFSYGRVAIRTQKTRWGSCSSKGNLNFNYKIILLSEKLRDYIIVHELCHLGEFNHSQRFWDLVGKTIPDYKELREELQKTGISLS